MKIGVVSNLYPPISRGGAERVVQRIVDELASRGNDVFVISTCRRRARSALATECHDASSARVYRFFPPNLYHLLDDHFFAYPVRALWHLIDLLGSFSLKCVAPILAKEQPNIILTHNLKGIGMRVPHAFAAAGIPFIHTLHDVQLSVPSGLLFYGWGPSVLERLTRRWYERRVQKAIGKPVCVISPSKFLADFYRDRGFFLHTPVHVLPNPAPDFPLTPRAERPQGMVRLLFAGQLARHKGILELIEAVDRAAVAIELHVAGEGVLADAVNERAKKDARIIYHGLASTESLQNLFAFTDATVVPSLCFENSPTIIYESLQAGVPVIASDIGGVGELIHHGENGLLVPPGDVEALVQTFEIFAKQADAFWSRGAAIRATMAHLSTAHYVDALERLMREVVGSSQRS